MLNSVEEFGQVDVGHVPIATTNRALGLLGGSVSRAVWSKAETRFAKVRIEQRRQDLDDGLLNQSIDYVWNT